MGTRAGRAKARVLASPPMLREFRRPARAILPALLVAVATASCGIKGPLKLPPKAPPAGAAESVPAPPATAKDAESGDVPPRLP